MIDEGMSTLKTNSQERQAALQNLLSRNDVSTKDADTAFLIELIGGIFTLFGLGHLYAGATNTGIFRLILGLVGFWIIYAFLGFTVIGLCAYPLVWIGQIALAYFSANDLKLALNAAKAGGRGMSNMGGTTGTGSAFGGYIENPTSTGSSDSLFGEPTGTERAYTPSSSPEINLGGSSGTSGGSAAGLYDTPADDSGNDDFDPNDLTKKV